MNSNVNSRPIRRVKPNTTEYPPINRRTLLGIAGGGVVFGAIIVSSLFYEPLDTTKRQEVIGVSCDAGFDALRIDVVDTPSNSGDDSDLVFRVACSGGSVLLNHDNRIEYVQNDAYKQSQSTANLYVQSNDTHGEYEDGESIRHWASEQTVQISSLMPGTAEITVRNADDIEAFLMINPDTGYTQELNQ